MLNIYIYIIHIYLHLLTGHNFSLNRNNSLLWFCQEFPPAGCFSYVFMGLIGYPPHRCRRHKSKSFWQKDPFPTSSQWGSPRSVGLFTSIYHFLRPRTTSWKRWRPIIFVDHSPNQNRSSWKTPICLTHITSSCNLSFLEILFSNSPNVPLESIEG